MKEVQKIVEAKIPVGKFSDEEIEYAIEEAEYQIRNYCNLPKPRFSIPKAAFYVWANMAVDALNESDSSRNPGNPVGQALASVKVGDTQYSFTDFKNAVTRTLDAILTSYARQLNRFRRLFYNDGEEYEGEEVYDTYDD